MFEISSSTVLFDDIPQKDFLNDGLDGYRDQISQEWDIAPVIPEPPKETEIQQIKPQKISLEGPKNHSEILKGSTGSKIMSLLSQMTPSSRTVMSRPEVKSSDVQRPTRKLRFS